MCGIAGFFHAARGREAARHELEPMVESIVHRGPDSAGYHCQDGIALGMRRLRIIDLEGGEQPMFDRDRTIALTFNGEIYNHDELRRDLEQRGHVFSTRSDTEVLVYLYKQYGEAMFEHLNGMFAIALADLKRRRVVLARDRIGIKPFFLAERDGTWLWGSEIKCLLAHPAITASVNVAHLPDYLFLNYMPPDRTLFEGIEQLRPGEMAVLDDTGLRRKQWWDLSMETDESIDETQAIEESMALLDDAVRLRLMSDVPFGAFLSGGIDSSGIVAMMAGHMDRPVKTFSIGFREKSFDERSWARKVAERYSTEHHELVVDPEKEILDLLPSIVEHTEEPTADSSALPVLLVSKLAREHVTMVLSGDGGDEVFAGYETYNAWQVGERWRRIPGWIRNGIIRPVVDALPVSDSKISFEFKAKRFVRVAELGAERAHFSWRRIVDEELQAELLGDRLVGPPPFERHRHHFVQAGTRDPLGRMLYVDTRFYLPGDMLVKVDRMSMANSLEARVPFLDHRLVEYAAKIPSHVKFPGGKKKHLLKKGLEPLLDHDLLYRKKAGFNVPKNVWLRGPLRELTGDVLAAPALARHGLLDARVVQRLLDEHQQRRADHSFAIWSVLIFQLWYDRFVSGN
jgi:asparagine synthase (glutamine-hydrolysing)